jgi:protein-tyrosine phosphatase
VIDLHCHVLPGLDDGPADDAEAAALLAHLAAPGIDVVAATPHYRADYPGVTPQSVRDAVARTRKLSGGVPAVLPAGEVNVSWAIVASDADLRAASYGGLGKYVLVESPAGALPPQFDDLMFRLRTSGLRPVLAHPERTQAFQEAPARLGRMAGAGVLVQLNAGSLLTEKRGSRARRLAVALLREGVATVIATDTHSAAGFPPRLSSAVEAAAQEVGARAQWMVTDAPAAILAGEPLPERPPPAEAVRRRRRRLPGFGRSGG